MPPTHCPITPAQSRSTTGTDGPIGPAHIEVGHLWADHLIGRGRRARLSTTLIQTCGAACSSGPAEQVVGYRSNLRRRLNGTTAHDANPEVVFAGVLLAIRNSGLRLPERFGTSSRWTCRSQPEKLRTRPSCRSSNQSQIGQHGAGSRQADVPIAGMVSVWSQARFSGQNRRSQAWVSKLPKLRTRVRFPSPALDSTVFAPVRAAFRVGRR